MQTRQESLVHSKAELVLRNNIKRFGKTYEFKRPVRNEFNEPTSQETTIPIKGLYHEENSYIQISLQDGGRIQSKKVPMIMYDLNDVNGLTPQNEDTIVINKSKFKVSGTVNIGELETFQDISLELITNV